MILPWHSTDSWTPTTFIQFIKGLDTSMGTAIVETDAASPFQRAYIKAMGNRQGPHALASEYIATRIAALFGLATLDMAIIEINAEFDEIPFFRGGLAESGPAIVTRAIDAHPWGGTIKELNHLVNPKDIARIIIFDTWLRNCDRYPPDLTTRRPNMDNVLIEQLAGDLSGKCRLVAMDHTHCFDCGRDLTPGISNIINHKDERLYGLFPAFRSHIRQEDVEAAANDLEKIDHEAVREIVHSIPDQWQVDSKTRQELCKFIERRAEFVRSLILQMIARECWPGKLFDK